MNEYLRRLFLYDDWANREEVAHLKNAPNPAALRLFAHIVRAEWVWLTRIGGTEPRMAVWPSLDLGQIEAELPKLHAEWSRVIPSTDLASVIRYRNSKGEEWSSNAGDILTHVAMHGAYHRGQIATVVRGAGHVPASTDFIHCTRIGAI
ncbi:MAG: DinB family protein [Thermoanaerobaculia bacterium]|nr:DinB family protein [Thermoanaerobaculia bacterium]